jgi:NifU-like protein
LRTIPEITNAIKAGGACMSCHQVPGGLQDLLDETWGKSPGSAQVLTQISLADTTVAKAEGPALSPYQFSKKFEQALHGYIRPLLRRDGGDVEIIDIKDTLIYCRLAGSCQGCAGASQTLRMLVEQNLKDLVDERIRVIEV